ncbi:MAG: hypothetical protein E6K63_03820 [Nitrospirae bacterium]|nr:MAG: hypothetical protein E6K63_03820 [Nitrospirota bacterium]
MTSQGSRHALYYPFHLCHEQTLQKLLADYSSLHFRDYMALQLTAMSGTTAYMDRMGNAHPELVASGRLVQGYSVSGPLDGEAIAAVNRDLADETWRSEFHASLLNDRRFQRGLFNLTHGVQIGPATAPGPAALLRLVEASRQHRPFSLQELQRLSGRQLSLEEGYDYEYGLALVKTSAALVYTIRLSLIHGLIAVTDSEGHFRLLERTCVRDRISINNRWIPREMY